jgi:hypothetical protein
MDIASIARIPNTGGLLNERLRRFLYFSRDDPRALHSACYRNPWTYLLNKPLQV